MTKHQSNFYLFSMMVEVVTLCVEIVCQCGLQTFFPQSWHKIPYRGCGNGFLISMQKILHKILLLCWLVYIYSHEGMIRQRSYFRMNMSPRPHILIEAAFPPTVNCPNLHQIRLNCFKLLNACMTYVL